jgi:nicotinamidase/pyrazinamidase
MLHLLLAVESAFQLIFCLSVFFVFFCFSAYSLARHCTMIRAGLLAVDLQNDFNEDGSLPVPGASKVPAEVNALAKALEKRLPGPYMRKFATKDWHEPGHIGEKTWAVHCIQNSYGAEFIKDFDSTDYSVILKGTVKTVESYSGFGSEGAPVDAPAGCSDGLGYGALTVPQEVTVLKTCLDSSAITHVIVCGLAFDVCVKNTALDALARGFKVCVVLSATRALSAESHAKTVAELTQAGVTIVENIYECILYIDTEAFRA